jgi:hypothetical protein
MKLFEMYNNIFSIFQNNSFFLKKYQEKIKSQKVLFLYNLLDANIIGWIVCLHNVFQYSIL